MKRSLNLLKATLIIFLLLQSFDSIAQVGINSTNDQPDASAMLDVQSTDKGLLMPRMTTDERDAISNPAEGLIVFNIDDSCFNYFTGLTWIKNCGTKDIFNSVPGLSAGGYFNDSGRGISLDASGNSYITGSFEGTVSFGDITLTSSGNDDIFVVKMDPKGQVVWAIRAGGAQEASANDIATDANGYSYITGYFYATATFGDTSLTSSGNSDAFIAKISPDGQFIWVSRVTGSQASTGYGIAIDTNENSYITGSFSGTATFGDTSIIGGGLDIFVGKADPSGEFLWAIRGGGTLFDEGGSIYTDAFGNCFVTGFFYGNGAFGDTTFTNNGNYNDVFVAKIDASGQLKWAIMPGGGGYKDGDGIASDGFGNTYITGYFGGTTTFGDTTLTASGIADIFVMKLDPLGHILWARQAGGTNYDRGVDISTDAAGNSLITGYFRGSAMFGNISLVSNGFNDAFVMKVDSTGEILWAEQGGGSNDDQGFSISMDSEGNGYTTGIFQGSSASFGDQTFSSNGGYDAFVWILNGTDGSIATYEKSLNELQDDDTNPENELQTLSLSGTDLSITNGNTVDLSGIATDTDDQTLSLSGSDLSIADGNTVDLSGIDTDTDNQTLSISGSMLTIVDGNTVDLSGIDTNTDDQTLSLSGSLLSITNGDTVNLDSVSLDNLGNHIATQNLELGNFYLSGDGGNEGVFVESGGQVGIGTNSAWQRLGVNGHIALQGDNRSLYFRSLNNSNQYIGEIKTDFDAPSGAVLLNPADVHMSFFLPQDDAGNRSEILSIQGDGSVGINVSAPTTTLEIKGKSITHDRPLQITSIHDNPNIGETDQGGILLKNGSLDEYWEMVHNMGDNGSFEINHKASNGNFYNAFSISRDNTNATGQVGKVVIQESLVGIGTDDPQTDLEVNEVAPEIRLTDTRSGAASFWSGGTLLGRLNFYTRDDNGGGYTTTGGIDMVTDDGTTHPDGRLEFRTAVNGTDAVHMAINSVGKIGIGTSSPEASLHVSTGVDASLTEHGYLVLGNTSADNIVIDDNEIMARDNGSASPLFLQTNGGNLILCRDAGLVGIGTSSPDAPLHVSRTTTISSFSGSNNGGAWMYEGSGSGTDEITWASSVGSTPVSIYASGSIVADGDGVFVGATVNWSDARVKEVKGISNAKEDLKTINEIEITDYRRIDGGRPEKKVIAQQLRDVFPQAVSFRSGVIPSIYEHIADFSYDSTNKTLQIETHKPHGLKVGDRVDYYTEANKFDKQKVIQILSEKGFLVAADHLPAELFVFGKWVEDVHGVDYDALSMLNISATQEQQRIIEVQQAEIEALEAVHSKLLNQGISFEARLKALEALIPIDQ